jgi:glycosyltransferase involved in cell wall biosynthesis
MPLAARSADMIIADSIANGLKKMITDKERRNKLAAKSKLNAARFSWGKSAQQLFAVFGKAISVRNGVQS